MNKQTEFMLPALGRSAFLGQLYNVRKEQFLNTQLFEQNDLNNGFREERVGSTSVNFSEIKTQSDRARALDVAIEFSISILCGVVDLSGAGSYVDTAKSNAWSHEVTANCTVLKTNRRLDLGYCVNDHKFQYANSLGATHVVTAIRYGGTLMASIIRKESTSDFRKELHAKLEASLFKSFWLAYVEGSASVDTTEIGHDFNSSCLFKVFGDWVPRDEQLPTTIGGVIDLIKRWPVLVGDGVPCFMTLTPISQFVDMTPVTIMIRELEQDKLMIISRAYDELVRLSARRERLISLVKQDVGTYCPGFLETCRDRKREVDESVGKAREELKTYVMAFRDGGASQLQGVEEFLAGIKRDFVDAMRICTEDEARLDLIASVRRLTTSLAVPFVTLEQLHDLVTKVSDGPIGVVIIPPSPNISSATNTFALLVQAIRAWRTEEDKKIRTSSSATQATTYVAYMSDSELDDHFLDLEGRKGILRRGLDKAKSTGESCFLYYGLISEAAIIKEFDWHLLNEDGWSLMSSQVENYSYIGYVKSGMRHGRGTVTYADGSTYTGDWCKDMRNGSGKLTADDGTVTEGIFIDNVYRSDGVLVGLSVFSKDEVLLEAYKVPLRKYDSTTSHILRIGGMLDWRDKDEYTLEVVSKTNAFQPLVFNVKGQMLKAGSNEGQYAQSWPLAQGNLELKARRT